MKTKIDKKNRKKVKSKKIYVTKKHRITIVAILGLILLLSIVSLANSYQKQILIEESINSIEYNQIGNYNYIAYINENLFHLIKLN